MKKPCPLVHPDARLFPCSRSVLSSRERRAGAVEEPGRIVVRGIGGMRPH